MSQVDDLPEIPFSASSETLTESIEETLKNTTTIKKATVVEDRPVSSDAIENEPPILNMPADTMTRLKSFLDKIDDIEPDQQWADVIKRGAEMGLLAGELDTHSEVEDSLWRQTLKAGEAELGAARPNFGDQHVTKLSGEAALIRIRELTGLGTTVQIPLYHSGFWVSIKAPEEGDLLELERRIAELKVELGRQTRGRIFANTTVAITGLVVDFVLSHVFRTTIRNEDVVQSGGLRPLILQQDIPTLFWGMALLVYPTGFNYTRGLITNNRQEVITRKLNVGRIHYVNNRVFTEWQLRHLARRFESDMTIAELEKYRSELVQLTPKEVKITDRVSFVLKPATISKYLENGQYWINSIVSRADKIMEFNENSLERNRYIYEQGLASILCQYNHVIDKVIVDGKQHIDDQPTIHRTLVLLSAEKNIREKVYEEVANNYLKNTVIAMVGLPTLTEEEDKFTEENNPAFPHLIPLDMIQTFFILLVQATDQIRNRE